MVSGSVVQLFNRNMRGWVEPADAFVMLFANDDHAFWLDRLNAGSKRFSVIGHAYNSTPLATAEMFSQLAARRQWPTEVLGDEPPFDFRPGFVGWFDYLQDPLASAEIAGSWLDVREALIFDHDARRIFLMGYFTDATRFEEWVKAAMIRLPLAGGSQIRFLQKHANPVAPQLHSVAHGRRDYLAMIDSAKEHIKSGDVYQICLTNQIRYQHQSNPLDVFLRLRQTNPSPYSNFIRCNQKTLVSSSPEQFLTVSAAGLASTSPIKGTRARHELADEDQALADELLSNAKERAENLMIVDLMRNDLGRVSQVDSVRVSQLFRVETHATVHQLVSSVEAQLRPGVGLPEVISSVFPAGSMTGAPKIRAMQIIDELEGVPRGVYSGAAGYLGIDGSADLGMVIRSLMFEADEVSIGVGGGITIDSDPQAEFDEIRLKAKALLDVLRVQDPWASA